MLNKNIDLGTSKVQVAPETNAYDVLVELLKCRQELVTRVPNSLGSTEITEILRGQINMLDGHIQDIKAIIVEEYEVPKEDSQRR